MFRRPIKSYQIVDHGIEHEQYFQGCGISFISYQDIATGMGNNYSDALDDAADSLAQNNWDTSTIEELKMRPVNGQIINNPDIHYYLSIRVK